jgi:hypothetical protein|nr:MAG TPA: hypothetical protein [Caudoviricetes sp.]
MYINCETNKYIDSAEYFFNPYIDMYCIIGTTYATETLAELEEMFESSDLLTEVPMPDYITEDYDGTEW